MFVFRFEMYRLVWFFGNWVIWFIGLFGRDVFFIFMMYVIILFCNFLIVGGYYVSKIVVWFRVVLFNDGFVSGGVGIVL